MFSNRTLGHEDEKLTLATIRSISNTTHLYTVQPIITMSGKLFGSLFLCSKENSERLSENIKKTLFQPRNIVLTCSKSGNSSALLLNTGKIVCSDHLLARMNVYYNLIVGVLEWY